MGLHQHNFACTAALRVNNVAVDCIVDRCSEGSDPLGIKPGTDSPCVTYVDHTIEKVKVETITKLHYYNLNRGKIKRTQCMHVQYSL